MNPTRFYWSTVKIHLLLVIVASSKHAAHARVGRVSPRGGGRDPAGKVVHTLRKSFTLSEFARATVTLGALWCEASISNSQSRSRREEGGKGGGGTSEKGKAGGARDGAPKEGGEEGDRFTDSPLVDSFFFVLQKSFVLLSRATRYPPS